MAKTDFISVGPFRIAFTKELISPNDKGRYSATFLADPGVPDQKQAIVNIRKLLKQAIVAEWGDDRKKWPPEFRAIDIKTHLSMNGKDGWPLRNGDLVSWDGFAGHVFFRASTLMEPTIVNSKRQPILDPHRTVFGGLICKVAVNAYTYKNESVGVNIGLGALQVIRDDGTRYGGSVNVETTFDIEEGDPIGAENPANYATATATADEDF